MAKNGVKTEKDPETGQFIDSPGPGRPKGQRNYATIYREALKKIAQTQNMTPEEIEEVMLQSGLKKAIKGDYNFYRDTMDRLHGKPIQKTDVTTNGKDVGIVLSKVEQSQLEEVSKLLDDK